MCKILSQHKCSCSVFSTLLSYVLDHSLIHQTLFEQESNNIQCYDIDITTDIYVSDDFSIDINESVGVMMMDVVWLVFQ